MEEKKIKLKEVLESILDEEITEDSAPYFLASIQQTLNKFKDTEDTIDLFRIIAEEYD